MSETDSMELIEDTENLDPSYFHPELSTKQANAIENTHYYMEMSVTSLRVLCLERAQVCGFFINGTEMTSSKFTNIINNIMHKKSLIMVILELENRIKEAMEIFNAGIKQSSMLRDETLNPVIQTRNPQATSSKSLQFYSVRDDDDEVFDSKIPRYPSNAPKCVREREETSTHYRDIINSKKWPELNVKLFHGYPNENVLMWLDDVAFECKKYDIKKLDWAKVGTSYLKGASKNYLIAWTKREPNWTVWETFEEYMKKIYLPLNYNENLSRKLNSIRQTGSVASYNAQFSKVASQLQNDAFKETIIFTYLDNLKRDVYQHVSRSIDYKESNTLFRVMEMALEYENAKRTNEIANLSGSKKRPYFRNKAKNDGKCRACGKFGHYERNCFTKQPEIKKTIYY